MGDAKRRKQQLQQGAPDPRDADRLMDDFPLPPPRTAADPAAVAEQAREIRRLAGLLRQDGAGVRTAGDKLSALGEVITRLALPRLEEGIASFTEAIDEVPAVPIGCAKGCDWCCRQPVEATIPEAIAAARLLLDRPDDERRAKAAAVAAFDIERRAAGAEVPIRPCPFLGPDDGACTIYQARPMACRSYLAPEPERCRLAFAALAEGRIASEANSYIWPRYLGHAYLAAVCGIARDAGLQSDPVELSATVAAIVAEPGLIDRWQAGERVFAPIR